MIHEIGMELRTALAAKGCPFAVVDGPERTQPATYARERIVLEHDEGDTFGPVRGEHRNPKHRMTRQQAMKLTIYAQASAAGAMEFEHRRRAEHVLDLVLVALGDVAGGRKNLFTPKSGAFVLQGDLAKSETIGGAVYELKFTFDRAVMVQTWAGAKRPEASVGGFSSETKVSGDSSPGTETACGA